MSARFLLNFGGENNMLFKRSDRLSIGGKSVTVRKITIAQWEELFDVVQTLPQLIISVLTASAHERAGFLVVAMKQSFGDVVNVVSVLTGIDTEHIRNNASLDELVEYFTAVVKKNDFLAIVKNVQSVLNLPNRNQNPTVQNAE